MKNKKQFLCSKFGLKIVLLSLNQLRLDFEMKDPE